MIVGVPRDFVLLFPEDGSEPQVLNFDHKVTLEEAQTLVGGYIDIVYAERNPCVQLVFDEEANWPKHKPLNKRASLTVNRPIYGPLLMLGGDRCLD